jgi:hypothetical protein
MKEGAFTGEELPAADVALRETFLEHGVRLIRNDAYDAPLRPPQ